MQREKKVLIERKNERERKKGQSLKSKEIKIHRQTEFQKTKR